MNDYERYKTEGYIDTTVNPNLDDISKVDISTSPMGNNREDKAVTITNQDGITKKTSSIMMGYNKKGIVLPDGEYINLEEMISAIDKELDSDSQNIVAFVQKTGKEVDVSEIKERLVNELKRKAEILLGGKSEKITNQETTNISIKGENSEIVHNKGTLMLGNENINMKDGEYVNREEAEKIISEYDFLKPGEEIEVVEIKPAESILKKFKKPLIIAGGLTALSIVTLPILLPGIMHANSVLWHTDLAKSIPVFQDFLHACNNILGKFVSATYVDGPGTWAISNGSIINSDAAQASVLAALGLHAVNTTSIGVIAKNLITEIKNRKKQKRERKLEELNNLKEELSSKENVHEGGLSR